MPATRFSRFCLPFQARSWLDWFYWNSNHILDRTSYLESDCSRSGSGSSDLSNIQCLRDYQWSIGAFFFETISATMRHISDQNELCPSLFSERNLDWSRH